MREFSSFLNDVKTAKSKPIEINLASATPVAPKVSRNLLFVTDESRRSVHLAKVTSQIAKILKCKPQNLLITMGASSAFLHAIAAITKPGDKVIVEDPTYEPLYATSKFLSLKTLRFKRTSDFDRDYAQLKKMRAQSGILVISNPHNPTGWMYSKAQLQKLAKLFEYVVVDEIFLPIFTGESTRAAKVRNIISLGGLSKTLGLSSLRIGWIKASPEILKRADQMGLNTYVDLPTLSLVGAEAVLPQWNKIISHHRKLSDQNRKTIQKFGKQFPGTVSHEFTQGHFGTLEIPKRFSSAKAFAYELEKQSLKVCACDHLGLPRSIRICTYIEPSKFSKALKLLAKYY